MTRLLEVCHFDGKSIGIFGIINGIKWLGVRDWLQASWHWHKLATENGIYEWKSGN